MRYVSKLGFMFAKRDKEAAFLDSLPFIMKHSIFLDPVMMGRMRTLTDIGQLFFIADDTKIKGNRFYDRGRYYDALDAYEQVLGCFLWLEPKGFTEREEFEATVFERVKFKGLTDGQVEVREKEVVREEDREFENETSKR